MRARLLSIFLPAEFNQPMTPWELALGVLVVTLVVAPWLWLLCRYRPFRGE